MVVDYTKRRKPSQQPAARKNNVPASPSRDLEPEEVPVRSSVGDDFFERERFEKRSAGSFFTKIWPIALVIVLLIKFLGNTSFDNLTMVHFIIAVFVFVWAGQVLRAKLARIKKMMTVAVDQVDSEIKRMYLAGDKDGAIERLIDQTGLSYDSAEKFLPIYIKSATVSLDKRTDR
jgi:Flp pilus assembly protein TadB